MKTAAGKTSTSYHNAHQSTEAHSEVGVSCCCLVCRRRSPTTAFIIQRRQNTSAHKRKAAIGDWRLERVQAPNQALERPPAEIKVELTEPIVALHEETRQQPQRREEKTAYASNVRTKNGTAKPHFLKTNDRHCAANVGNPHATGTSRSNEHESSSIKPMTLSDAASSHVS